MSPHPDRARRAKRSLGQNFLVDDRVAQRIVGVLECGPDDEVLEIGPGRGALTRHLAGTVRRLVVVELDDALAAELADRYRDREDVLVVHGDALRVERRQLLDDPPATKVVGNIPYNITTPLLFRFLERPRPRRLVLTVQREVAERVVAQPGSKSYGALSVGVQTMARAEICFRVARGSFRPVPGVESAVLDVRPVAPEPLTAAEERAVRTLVRAAFQWRRKQLGTILRDHPDLGLPAVRLEAVAEQAGVSLTDRPERLAPGAFVRLAASLP